MINSEDKEVIKTALSKFDETRINDIESEIRGLIISVAVRHGKDPKLADRLLKLYPTISSHELKLDICSGLTSTRDKITVNKILSTLTDKTIVKPQDLVYFFVFLLNNRYARNETWLWLKTNWPWIKSTFGGDQSYRSFVKYSAERLFEKQN
jgi:aminopeptidase N